VVRTESVIFWVVKMEVISSSETLVVLIYRTIRRHNQADHNPKKKMVIASLISACP
jgi:hypothetical protein